MTAAQMQGKRLRRIGKELSFVPCPNCEERGGVWEAYDQSIGWYRWCYKCGHLEPALPQEEWDAKALKKAQQRREDQLRSQISQNEFRIRKLLQELDNPRWKEFQAQPIDQRPPRNRRERRAALQQRAVAQADRKIA